MSSPSSTQASDGLGPLFNARACQSCHLKDGRGHPPEGDPDTTSMFLRLARDAEQRGGEGGARRASQVLNFPDPVYGTQLQDLAVPGLRGEGRMHVDYQERQGDAGGRHRGFAAQAELFGRPISPMGRSIRAPRCRRA